VKIANRPGLAAMPLYFHQQTLKMRDRVGTQLVPTFRAYFRALSTVLSGLVVYLPAADNCLTPETPIKWRLI